MAIDKYKMIKIETKMQNLMGKRDFESGLIRQNEEK